MFSVTGTCSFHCVGDRRSLRTQAAAVPNWAVPSTRSRSIVSSAWSTGSEKLTSASAVSPGR